MSDNIKPPMLFWVIAGLALLWNLMGVGAYVVEAMSSQADLISKGYSEYEAVMAKTKPAWVTGAFAIAVFGGAIGCLGLLLRKKWALTALIVSLVAVIVQQIYIFGMTDAASKLSGAAWVMPIMIPIIAIFLVWFAKKKISKGYLR